MEKLSAKEIKKYLNNDFSVMTVKTIPSTNTELKRLAKEGICEFSVLIAEEQTNGRGRLGRSFYSPKDTGIYMSVLFRPQFSPENAFYMTPAAAVSVCRALESEGSKKTYIKWVNDIFCEGKKVCGILTESEFKNENELDYLVVGIGINLTTSDFPENIKDIANSAFCSENISRNKLIAKILDNLYDYYTNITERKFSDEYKNRSIAIGKDVLLVTPTSERKAHILGIDDEFRLIARFADGTIEHIQTGEISVRI